MPLWQLPKQEYRSSNYGCEQFKIHSPWILTGIFCFGNMGVSTSAFAAFPFGWSDLKGLNLINILTNVIKIKIILNFKVRLESVDSDEWFTGSE